MLFTLGLLLLLTPFPSFQTTINEKKDSTGGNVTKPNAVFTLSKPKTTSTLAKQTVRPTLKPNTHNQTVLPTPATNQKPQTFNATATTKGKASAAVIQTTPSTVVKAPVASGPITNKDKHTVSVNQTGLNKSPSASELRTSKDKPAPTGAPNVQSTSTRSALASNAKTTKDKLQPFVNQTVSMKSPSTGDGKIAKDKPAPTVVQNVVSTSTKSALANGAKTTKNKPTASVNQTVVVKSPSPSDVKNSKDKTAPNAVQTPLSTPAKAAKASGSAVDKDKVTASANRTIAIKASTTKDKPTPNAVQTPLSTPAKAAKASGSAGDKDKATASATRTTAIKASNTNKDKSAPNAVQTPLSTTAKATKASGSSGDKDKATASASQTTAIKAPNTNKDKSAPNAVQTPLSTPAKATKASGSAGDKDVASANRTVVVKAPSTTKEKPALTTVQIPPSTPAKATTASGSAADKDEASANRTTVIKAAPSQPIKVVISDGWDSSKAKEQELKLKPGTPLVMTHKISLLSGGCAGECEAEMTTLKERVTRLEREMSLLKDKCSGSANCPDDCSGNGVCENRKCVCHQGFVGPDCSKCAQGAECNKKAAKSKAKETVELVTFQKKESETKETDSKARVASNATPGQVKTQAIQEVSVKKISTKGSSSATKTSRPTVGQVLLKHEGRKQEEVRKGKTTVLTSKKVLQKSDLKLVKQGSVSRTYPKTDHLKDEPHTNVTQVNMKKSNGTAKIVTILSKGMGTNKTRTGKEILEQSTLAEKNITNSSGHKRSKTVKVDTINVQSVHNRNTETGKGKVTQRIQYVVNESIAATSDEARALQNKTTIHVSGMSRGTGGSGLGSVKVVNISSYSFTVTWSAPQGMFKNFTVIRREPKTEGDEDDHEEFEEEALEGDKTSTNPNEVQVQTESNNTTVRSGKTVGSVGKAETKRISMVVPGSVRSVEFSNLRANTRYVLHIYGIGAERRSKIHRVTAVTGPEPATEMIFSNVTESSLAVSWSKPKTTFKSFRVTFTNIVTGESRFVVVHSQQSNVVLSKLSAGSSYIVSVTTTQGRTQSDALVSIITTVPAPPTHLQVVNVSDTRAVLQWTPSLGKVDRFIISYESSKTPNVTVTVMLSGNSVEHQLRGLQRGTLYTVKVLSQKDSLQSMAISTTFTTANVVKANEVGARSAVITWKTSTVVYHSYRVVYQVAGEETKEVILDPTITEYKLTGLLPMSRYIVLVQGERDGHYTSVITTEFITGKLRFPFPTECSQELLNGALQSGEVDIYPQGKEGQAVRVYCDMETDGGGWTVFQRRMNGKTDFYRTWSEYRAGFGNLSEEFWLGNEVLHNLTNVGPVSLRVDMQSGNDTAYAHYANFSISSEERHYTLTVSSYTGTAGDSMRYHNGRPFSTRDKDPDSLGIHCSKAYMGGWWYKNCYKTNLNGLYGINSNNQGIVWIDWKGKDSSIPFTEMKFRPSKFSPATHG